MKLKKASVIGGITLLFLTIIVVVILYMFIGPGAKDIRAAKDFMTKLYSINAINTEQNLDSIKYERSRILNSQNELVHRSIVTQSFGIDLDKNNNVIGFAKKEIKANSTKVELQDARSLAEKYLKNIFSGEVLLKTVNANDGSNNLPYYSFIYTEQKNGYPLYFDEIKLNIDKENGFLDGYSNSTMQKECKEPVINISDEKAKEAALDYFQKYNKDGIVRPETNLVYADNKIDKGANPIYEVCYIVTIDGKTDKDASSSWKVFVSSENGNILNVLKDGAEKEVITKSN
ncbi:MULTISPECIES: YcdB/YcdC domain-containing protein [unclassified Clostridium]|uniref:YcdB/YcdC domain-containing protein n=1 Tax=unclassified Clostridium TaxID=2614128 RepID=UPI0002980A54|nr:MULTISPECIES: YcdB/YcdC domain-containing protein [unclassified Clostridium]EKQ51058.1 MAG: Peptidase propeptide domain-containing protein [Clostridium sp. Maddingley MBC34-26]